MLTNTAVQQSTYIKYVAIYGHKLHVCVRSPNVKKKKVRYMQYVYSVVASISYA